MKSAFLKNEISGELYPVEKECLVVGRSDDCDIVINKPTVSRKHLKISSKGEEWFVEDLNSHNGTELNGIQINPREQCPLRAGDSLLLGTTIPLTFEWELDDKTIGVQNHPSGEGQKYTAPHPESHYESVPHYSPKPVTKAWSQPEQTAPTQSAAVETIRVKINEAMKKGKTSLYIIYGLLLLGVILSAAVHISVGFLVIMPIILVFLNYNDKYSYICSSMKCYTQEQIDRMLSGSWDETPSCPISRVYCGDYALFSEKDNLLLPLENLAWVYMTETKTKAMGLVTVAVTRSANFCYRNGIQYSTIFFEDELKDLLNRRVVPLNPDVLIGYTEENRRLYAQMTGKN